MGTQTNQKAQMNAKHKPRLNTHNRAVWTGPGSCAHGNFQCTV